MQEEKPLEKQKSKIDKKEGDGNMIDPNGVLNGLVNKDIEVKKKNGDTILGMLRTITPANQLFMADGTTIYRKDIESIKKR